MRKIVPIPTYRFSLKFFLKAHRSTGESYKILSAHANRTQRKRGYPSSLGTRHTAVLTPQHTHTPHTHATVPMEIQGRVMLEPGIGCLHTWSASRPSYARFPKASRLNQQGINQLTLINSVQYTGRISTRVDTQHDTF